MWADSARATRPNGKVVSHAGVGRFNGGDVCGKKSGIQDHEGGGFKPRSSRRLAGVRGKSWWGKETALSEQTRFVNLKSNWADSEKENAYRLMCGGRLLGERQAERRNGREKGKERRWRRRASSHQCFAKGGLMPGEMRMIPGALCKRNRKETRRRTK